MSMYLTKDKNVAAGQKKEAGVTFIVATDEELNAVKKALNATELPDGYVAGWASTADIDSYGHKIVKGAFEEAIQKRGLTGPKGIKLLIGHNWNQVGGVIKVLEYRGSRLWIEAQMALDIGYVADAYKAAKLLGGLNFSVGFMLQDYQWKETPDKAEYLQIDRGDLFEVSIVPFPGNEEAVMTFIKSADGDDPLAKPDDSTYAPDESDTELASVSEFEKTLILNLSNDVFKLSRNQAREITRLVKANVKLFEPKEAPVAPPEPEKKTGPVLDQNQLTKLLALVGDMKSVIAPVAK